MEGAGAYAAKPPIAEPKGFAEVGPKWARKRGRQRCEVKPEGRGREEGEVGDPRRCCPRRGTFEHSS